uniref:Uncharacterized protein n=1 Tax=Ciona intestinalis TaxID=7719 RepID=H2XM08_CIOIN
MFVSKLIRNLYIICLETYLEGACLE